MNSKRDTVLLGAGKGMTNGLEDWKQDSYSVYQNGGAIQVKLEVVG